MDQWLDLLGLRYDPFRALDAGEDERLHEYLVAHETFETIRGDQVSFVFAPAGGGKSAFRTRLAGACRVGEGGRRVFPIVYMLPETVILAQEAELLEAHLQSIAQAAAFELLLRLAYRPHEFTDLDLPDRQLVRSLLDHDLPGSLDHFLDQLQSPADLPRLARSYDPTARWPKAPEPEVLRDFCQNLRETSPLPAQSGDVDRLAVWLKFLTGTSRFEAVYLLLDGVDAYPETVYGPEKALSLLSPILEQAGEWAAQGLFLKAFLPREMEAVLVRAFPQLTSNANLCRIKWPHDLLVSFIRRRIEAATEMAPGSLDMLCDPGLRGADRLVAEAVRPLPREVLVFIERLFTEHILRAGPTGKLARDDLNAARRWYKSHDPASAVS